MSTDGKWNPWDWGTPQRLRPLIGLFLLSAPLAAFCVWQIYSAATTGWIYAKNAGNIRFEDAPILFVLSATLMAFCGMVLLYIAVMALKTLLFGLRKRKFRQ
jgi:hypothetical protein